LGVEFDKVVKYTYSHLIKNLQSIFS